jgi:hypothetical protein
MSMEPEGRTAIMLTREKAVQSISRNLDSNMEVHSEAIIEKDYGWLIFSWSKNGLQTPGELKMDLGAGGTLVEKETGRTFPFGSVFPTDVNLRIYEMGYLRYDNWDIEVTKVHDENNAVRLLSKLKVEYRKPQKGYDVSWSIPSTFTAAQLKEKLGELPARFNLGEVYTKWKTLELFKDQSVFEYELLENKGVCNIPSGV